MKYVCEFCNKSFNNPDAAFKCENAHKEEIARKEAKANAEQKINNAVNAFVAKYKTMPEIYLTEENQQAIADEVSNIFCEFMTDIFGSDDECSAEENDHGCYEEHCECCGRHG